MDHIGLIVYLVGVALMGTLTFRRTPATEPQAALAVGFGLLWPVLLAVYVFDRLDNLFDRPAR